MVARTPPKHHRKQHLMVAPLNPTLLRETLNKVDLCMARLQELQYTVSGGAKTVSGVNLSPRSTRGYIKASLRCKQETVRIKGGKRSPTGKLPSTVTGDWHRMSLPAMLLGETVKEILKASKFTTDIAESISGQKFSDCVDDPKTPVTIRRKQRPSEPEMNTAVGIESRRKREKQHKLRIIRLESDTPAPRRARSRINFKVPSPGRAELAKLDRRLNSSEIDSARYLANRVSPRHRPWAKKAVLFPNPLFNLSPNSQQQRFFSKTKSPMIAKRKSEIISPAKSLTPHKFLVKTPTSGKSKFQVKIKSPVAVAKISPPKRRGASPLRMVATATAAKLRRSLSPARLASRLMSPLKKSRNSSGAFQGGCGGNVAVSGVKQRPGFPVPRRL